MIEQVRICRRRETGRQSSPQAPVSQDRVDSWPAMLSPPFSAKGSTAAYRFLPPFTKAVGALGTAVARISPQASKKAHVVLPGQACRRSVVRRDGACLYDVPFRFAPLVEIYVEIYCQSRQSDKALPRSLHSSLDRKRFLTEPMVAGATRTRASGFVEARFLALVLRLLHRATSGAQGTTCTPPALALRLSSCRAGDDGG